MASVASEFFKSLYTKDENVESDQLLSSLDERVSREMNDMLCKEFSDEEIGDALFQISLLKAPGPDGFPARFFQHNWGLVKEDIIRAVKQFFSDGDMPDKVLTAKIGTNRSDRSDRS